MFAMTGKAAAACCTIRHCINFDYYFVVIFGFYASPVCAHNSVDIYNVKCSL